MQDSLWTLRRGEDIRTDKAETGKAHAPQNLVTD